MPTPPSPISTVIALGALPPPMNGQSKNFLQITDDIAVQHGVRLVRQSVSIGQLNGDLKGHFRKVKRQFSAWRILLRYASQKQRVLYFVADGGKGLVYSVISAALGRMLGYRLVLQHRTFGYIYDRRILMVLLNRLLGANGTHVFLSDGMAKKFFALYHPERHVEINHNLAQTYRFWQKLRSTPRQRPTHILRVGMLSNLMLSKGLDVFLDVARRADAEKLPCKFILAGPAYGQKEERMINDAIAEFGDRLEWIGPVQGDAKLHFYRALDVFMFPTRYRYEAQPNVVLEAICAGVYVIAPDRGCIAEDLTTLGGTCIPRSKEADVDTWFKSLKIAASDRPGLIRQQADSLRKARMAVIEARAHYNQFLNGFVAGDKGE